MNGGKKFLGDLFGSDARQLPVIILFPFSYGTFPLATLLVNYLGTFLLVYLAKKGYLSRKGFQAFVIGFVDLGFCGEAWLTFQVFY